MFLTAPLVSALRVHRNTPLQDAVNNHLYLQFYASFANRLHCLYLTDLQKKEGQPSVQIKT